MEEERIYIAPANFKNGRKIFGMYHISDLIIIAAGTLAAVIGCILCFNQLSGKLLIAGIVIFVSIGCICWILTSSFSVYHNILGFLIEYFEYLVSEKNYVFGGIVYYDEEKEHEGNEKNRFKKTEKNY